ncbi:MAG TPA: caspase family protein [Polyangia bacterium]|nr:caspase family protein [Polyangia bacterium]
MSRRVFIPFGVGRPGGGLRDLDAVPVDLARMGRSFEARGYAVAPVAPDLEAAEARAALGALLDAAALGPDDAAVLYFSGHGCVVDGDHYLAARGFSSDRAAATGVKTQELLEIVTRRRPRAGKVWLILDCCGAGGALHEALSRGLGAAGAQVFVLAASAAWSSTFDGSFSAAFVEALDAETSLAAGPSLDELVATVNARRREARVMAAALCWSRFDLLDEPPGRRAA